MDIEERGMDDDAMEYEELPSTDMPIDTDGLVREDEVMGTETTLATDTNPVAIDADGDVDLDVEYDDGDGMEAEPTPIPAEEGVAVDPFFATPAVPVLGIAEPAQGLAPETVEAAASEGGVTALAAAAAPLSDGASDVATGSGGLTGDIPESSSALPPVVPSVASSSSTSQPPVPATQNLSEETVIADAEAYYETGGEGEEEYYYEDDPETTTGNRAQSTFVDGESDPDSEDQEYDLEVMLTPSTLPTVILQVTENDFVSLFSSPNPAHNLPAGVTPATPVSFPGRHAELSQVPLADLLALIRQELAAGRKDVMGMEMVMKEGSLGVELGEHDKHLSNVTLLEYLQIHHSCGLPNPVKFVIEFSPSRFWDRFVAIQLALERASELPSLETEAEAMGEKWNEEVEEVEEEGEEEHAEAMQGNVTAQDQDELPQDQNEEGKAGGAESAHPRADWARTLATAPLAYGIGKVSSPNFRKREFEADRDVASPAPVDKGRSSRQVDDEPADTTEDSATDSRTGEPAPMDEIALMEAGLHPNMTAPQKSGEEVAISGEVGKDEIALMEEREAAERGDGPVPEAAGTSTYLEDKDVAVGAGVASEGARTPIEEKAAGDLSMGTSTEHDITLGSTTALLFPAVQSEAGNRPLVGSSLANEVLPEQTEEESAVSAIPEATEGDDGEAENGEEEETDGDDQEGVTVECVGEGEEEALEGVGEAEYEGSREKMLDLEAEQDAEDEEVHKTPLQIAVEDGVIPESAAEAVAGEDWDEGYAEEDTHNDTEIAEDPINPYAEPVDGEISPTTSTTVDDEVDEGDYEVEEVGYEAEDVDYEAEEVEGTGNDLDSPVGSMKRRAEDDDEEATASVKRTRSAVQPEE